MRVNKAVDGAMLKHSSSKRGNESAKMFASERASLSSTPHLKEQRSCSRCAAQNKSKRGNERKKQDIRGNTTRIQITKLGMFRFQGIGSNP